MNPNENNHVFEDRQGTVWDVTLTLAGATRIDRSDFTNLTDKEFKVMNPNKQLFMDILTETAVLFAMVWAVVRPQAPAKLNMEKKEDETDASFDERLEAEFMDRLDGAAIHKGREVFWQSLAGFYPNHQAALLTLMEQFSKAERKISLAVKDMEATLEQALDAEINKGLKEVKKTLSAP